ncbi:hypothetical protein NS234_19205 [Microbacterium oxydans]|uniref:hypothetical protein n=1 Tax=Microbacterium oxydans TaxID=82380 RepID=UPI000734C85B|nr:hypothetical protein [Microbacterium oxydans]KTR74300.1 hypothetical protein NS234_19205 [Microbacterium oxydans]
MSELTERVQQMTPDELVFSLREVAENVELIDPDITAALLSRAADDLSRHHKEGTAPHDGN